MAQNDGHLWKNTVKFFRKILANGVFSNPKFLCWKFLRVELGEAEKLVYFRNLLGICGSSWVIQHFNAPSSSIFLANPVAIHSLLFSSISHHLHCHVLSSLIKTADMRYLNQILRVVNNSNFQQNIFLVF